MKKMEACLCRNFSCPGHFCHWGKIYVEMTKKIISLPEIFLSTKHIESCKLYKCQFDLNSYLIHQSGVNFDHLTTHA